MKANEKAIKKAKAREQNVKDIKLCIEHLVCPACASELEETKSQLDWPDGAPPPPPARDYKCTKCDFTY